MQRGIGFTMATTKPKRSGRARKTTHATLTGLVTLFESRGWLNRPLKVSRAGVSYRVSCSVTEFEVYRVNENSHIAPGVPGWPVCTLRARRVFHDSALSPFPSTEAGPEEWLRCLAERDFDALMELS